MWVPIVEYNEYKSEGADYFVKKYLDELLSKDPQIDTILLACTHYPLLIEKIKKHLPEHINVIPQGGIIAESLEDYLERHPEMETRISRSGSKQFYTTDSPVDFNEHATVFFNEEVKAQHLDLQ